MLHILPRRKAELSPLESGSLVHYILEHALRRAGARFAELSREELTALADGIADEYVRQNMPAAGARFAHLIARLKRAVANLLFYLQSEQAQSSFHPVAFEQAIGGSEAVKILLPSQRCSIRLAVGESQPLQFYLDQAVRLLGEELQKRGAG